MRRLHANKEFNEGVGGRNIPASVNSKVYIGENLTNQAGFNTATAFGAAAGSAAYDEILTGDAAKAIAQMFIV